MTKQKDFKVMIREALSEDLPFIVSSWTSSLYRAGYNQLIPKAIFNTRHSETILALMKRGARLKVICNQNDIMSPSGYICYEDIANLRVIHWIYVKQIYRQNKLGAELLTSLGISKKDDIYFTFPTYIITKLSDADYKFIYLPNLLDHLEDHFNG